MNGTGDAAHAAGANRQYGQADKLEVSPEMIRAAQANLQAFEPIYRAYSPLVHTYCRRRLGENDADDATSHVFMLAIRALAGFRPDNRRPASFRSWLFAIAHNVVIDRYRQSRPTTSLDSAPDDRTRAASMSALIDDEPSPDQQVVVAEQADEIARAIAGLKEPERSILDLRLLGLRRREIAAALGLTDAAVRSAQFRAFAVLRDELATHAPDPQTRTTRPATEEPR